jgi:4-hydroxy-tetrahydrodipicolinate reductase
MALRVIQWFTGTMARQQIRYLARRPDEFELVGCAVFHEQKEGRDAGDIAGIAPLGVPATRDMEKLLASGADVALVNPPGWDPQLLARILRAGINIVTTTGAIYLPVEDDYDLKPATPADPA